MARHTKTNLIKWMTEQWNTELKLGLVLDLLGDEETYRKKLLNPLRNAIETLTVEEIVNLLEKIGIDPGEQLWYVVRRKTSTTDVLIKSIIANECGYNTAEDIWSDMEYDLSDEKKVGKTRAWYRFWSKTK